MNNLIWIKCSNIVYVEREVLKLRNSSAMINFNNRVCVILNVFRGANTESEYFTKICCVKKDCQRIMSMKMKSISESKTRRKKLRAIRKKYIDVNTKKVYFVKQAGTLERELLIIIQRKIYLN